MGWDGEGQGGVGWGGVELVGFEWFWVGVGRIGLDGWDELR